MEATRQDVKRTDIVLRMTVEEAKRLKELMAYDIDIPRTMQKMGYDFDKIQALMGTMHRELRKLEL